MIGSLWSDGDTEHHAQGYAVYRVKPPTWWRPGGSWSLWDHDFVDAASRPGGRGLCIVDGGLQRGSALRLLDLLARRRKACRALAPSEEARRAC